MATHNVERGKHATLSAGVVDQVNFSRSNSALRVANRHATLALYFTFDGTDPTVAGDNTYYVAPGTSVVVESGAPYTIVELISSGGCDYSAEVY